MTSSLGYSSSSTCVIPSCLNERNQFKAYCSTNCENNDPCRQFARLNNLHELEGFYGPPWPKGFYIRRRNQNNLMSPGCLFDEGDDDVDIDEVVLNSQCQSKINNDSNKSDHTGDLSTKSVQSAGCIINEQNEHHTLNKNLQAPVGRGASIDLTSENDNNSPNNTSTDSIQILDHIPSLHTQSTHSSVLPKSNTCTSSVPTKRNRTDMDNITSFIGNDLINATHTKPPSAVSIRDWVNNPAHHSWVNRKNRKQRRNIQLKLEDCYKRKPL